MFFEVLLGDRWWAFDARVNERRIGRIVVARGRDAADVPMISTLGAAEITDFAVDVTVVGAPQDSAELVRHYEGAWSASRASSAPR